MEQISEYKTLRAHDTKKLDELVNAAIAEGFQPYGSPYTQDNFSCQAMTKKDSPKPPEFQTETVMRA